MRREERKGGRGGGGGGGAVNIVLRTHAGSELVHQNANRVIKKK